MSFAELHERLQACVDDLDLPLSDLDLLSAHLAWRLETGAGGAGTHGGA